MKTAFNISSEGDVISNMFVELSNEGLSYVAFNENKAIALKIYRFGNGLSYSEKTEELQKLYADEELLRRNGTVVKVSCSFAESVISPAEFTDQNESEELLKILYGDGFPTKAFQDDLPEQRIVNNYFIPEMFSRFLEEHHPSARVKHQYSFLIGKLVKSETTISVLFYFEKIIIFLYKDGNLQLAQSFLYKAPADVVYHLLNVSNQFTIKDAPIRLFGMIEKQSALYEEIHNYFLNILFAELPEGLKLAQQFSDYPPHIFAHLLYTAL